MTYKKAIATSSLGIGLFVGLNFSSHAQTFEIPNPLSFDNIGKLSEGQREEFKTLSGSKKAELCKKCKTDNNCKNKTGWGQHDCVNGCEAIFDSSC